MSIHTHVCVKAKKANDLQVWLTYGCSDCKKKLRAAQKKYEKISDIARHANIETEGSVDIQRERKHSQNIHGAGIYHPLIGTMFLNEIRTREIKKIRDKDLKSLVIMFWNEENNMVSDVWSRY